MRARAKPTPVVICLKISTFVVSTTTGGEIKVTQRSCDLLKNIYLCGINNNSFFVIRCLSKGYKVVGGNKKWCHKTKSHFKEVGFLFSIKVTSYDPFSKFFLVVG